MVPLKHNAPQISQSPLWYGEQDANGVDLSLLRENLKLTPRERLLRADRAAQRTSIVGTWPTTAQTESSQLSDLEQIALILLRHGVEFLIVGGQAETLMGSPRVTYDTDLCYRRTKENLERLADALKEMNPTLRGAPPDLPFALDAHALAFGSNYTLNTSLGPLDLLGWVEPLGTYESLFPASETYIVGELPLRTIGLEDLIRIKQHIGRAKDRESLLQLLAIRSLRGELPEA